MKETEKNLLLATLLLVLACGAGASDWPQWRGPNRDGVVPEALASADWSKAPTKVWSITLRGGHSSPVVSGDRVVQHFHAGGNEVVAAFDLATGRQVWRDSYAVSYSPLSEAQGHGLGPFATPTIANGRVFTFGIKEMLSAYDLQTGRLLWRKDWGTEFKTPRPVYGTSASPLVADGKVIVYVGGPGKGALVALDPSSGATVWRLDGEGPPYGPAVVATFGAAKQVITQSESSLMGVDLATGARLWQRPFKVPYDNTILTPIIDGENVLLAAYDVDLQAFKVTKAATGWTSEVMWAARQPMYMSSPVLVGGRLYGMTQMRRGQLFALDPKAGKVLWTSPGGMGEQAMLIAAGKHLLVLTDSGELHLLALGDTYRPIAKHLIADSATWAHPALLSGGRLLVKDAEKLTLWGFASKEIERVDVKSERHRSVTWFVNPLKRLEAAGKTDLDHMVSEGSPIRDHVDVAGPDVAAR